MLIYGDPGIGKTVLAGSAQAVPELQPVLVLDIEGGTLSLRDFYPDAKVVRIKNWRDLNKLYEGLAKGSKYKTLVVDSLTEMQKFGMYQIMSEALDKDSERDPLLPGIGEWGKNTEQMRLFIRKFRDLPINTIFTALDAPEQLKNGKTRHWPAMSNKLSREVSGLLDIVMYMYKRPDPEDPEQQLRLLLTEGTDEAIAKDRTNKLPLLVQNPTMQQLHDIIFGD